MSGKSQAPARVTIHELARRLGLSAATVSYALNGRPGVGDETRERVLALARELDWYPSSSARALSHSRADTIGMVLSRDPALLGQEPFYMSLLSGVEAVLSDAGQSLMLRMVGAGSTRDLDVYRKWSAERRVDGFIVLDRRVDDPRPELLTSLGMPYVMHGMNREPVEGEGLEDDVVADARELIDHLAGLGHVDIVDVTGPLNLVHEVQRRKAVSAHAAERGMNVIFAECDYTRQGAQKFVGEKLPEWPRITGIISSNDVMALGIARALQNAGRTEVALVSWDDSMLCEIAVPAITALARTPELQGERSARLLLRTIAGAPAEEPEPANPSILVVRDTSVPAPAA